MEQIKWYKKPEMLVGFSALFISMVTAVVGIYSAYVDREYARASVWPRLVMYYEMQTTDNYSVSNRGTGPAIIKYAKIKEGTKNIKFWREVSEFPNVFNQSHIGGMTLPSNETIKMVGSKESQIFRKSTQPLTIELCYCSIYDECWVIDREGYEPKPVAKCEIDEEERFLQ
jgi:hypothetical protein